MAVEVDAFTTGLWRFDEPSNLGALGNGTFTGAGGVGYRASLGQSGVPSAECDQSVDAFATISDPGNLLRFERTQAFSVAGWVSYAGGGGGATTSVNGVIYSNAAVTTLRGITLFVGVNRRLKIKLTSTTTTNELVVRTTTFTIDDGRLHHIVFRYDGTSTAAGCQIWVDGASQALTTEITNLTATIVSTGAPCIARQGSVAGGANWIGTMQNLAVFNAAISPAVIAALFALGSNTPVPPQSNLVATWCLDRTDDFVAAGGILDRASGGLGTFNASGNGLGFGPHIAFLAQTSAGRQPAYMAGPRTAAAGRLVDVAWWATRLSGMGVAVNSYMNSNGGGVNTQFNKKGWVQRMLVGDAYTVEGWWFMERAQNMCPFAFNTGSGGGQNLFTFFILSNRAITVYWNTTPVRQTTSAAGVFPFQTWAHVAITCVRAVGSYNITIYVAGNVVHTASLIAPVAFDAFSGNLTNECCWGISQVSGSPDEFAGGMAYMRLSTVARSVLEISAAAADPSTIVSDANTVELYTGQIGQQVYDQSRHGHHAARRGAIQGDAAAWFAAPFDGYGVTGPTFNDLAHQFINSGANLGYYSMIRQEVVDTWTGQNEATYEAFIRMDQDLNNHRIVRIGGSEAVASDAAASNAVLHLDLLSNRAFRVFNESTGGYGWLVRTVSSIISQDGQQSGEFGMFWCLAAVKRAAGDRNYWLTNGTTQWTSAGDIAPTSFERTAPFSVSFRAMRLAHGGALEQIFGKRNAVSGQGWSVILEASGRIEFRLDNGAGQAIEKRVTSTTYNDRLEHTYTITYSGSSTAAGVLIYVDGVLQTMTVDLDTLASGSTLTTAPLSFCSRNGTDRFFPGYTREFAIWNSALSAGQVSAVHNFQGSAAPNLLALSSAAALRGWWRFDQSDTAVTVFDQSGVGNNATPQAGLAPTVQGSAFWDIYKNAVLFETLGPIPAATVGNIYSEADNTYALNLHFGGEVDSRAITRMSNKARTPEELLQFFQQETGVPEPPTLEVVIISPLPVGSLVDSDEPLICHVKSTQPFVRIMLNMSYPGFPFTEAAYTQNPADASLGKVFEPLFSSSIVSEVADPDMYVYRFELRRNTPWPGSPQLKAYAFAGGGEV